MEFKFELDDTGEIQVLFPISYEVPNHVLDFDTVVKAGRGVRQTYRSAGIALYATDFEPELVIGAFEEGSVVQWIGKKSMQAVFIGTAFAAQEFSDGFLETATGKTFRDWGSVAAEYAKELPEAFDEWTEGSERSLQQKLIEAETCRRILEVDEDELESILSERPDAAQAAESGRRTFYEACRSNRELPSVRFGTLPGAIRIRRSEFRSRTRRTAIQSGGLVADIAGLWKSEILDIEVTSPNWDRLDQQRGWKGKLASGKHIYFHIEDSAFWRKVLDHSLTAAAPDQMIAQVVFEDVNGRYKNAVAIRVLQFNGEAISKKVGEQELRSKLEGLESAGKQWQQALFESED